MSKEIVGKIYPVPGKSDLSLKFVNALLRNQDKEIYRKIMSGEKLTHYKDLWDLTQKRNGLTYVEIGEIFAAQVNTGKKEGNVEENEGRRGVLPSPNSNSKFTPRVAGVAPLKEDVENIKKLKFLRKDLETQSKTYFREHGGIDNIGEFVEVFLGKNRGYRNSWHFDVVMSEAGKVCRKILYERQKVSDLEDTGEGKSMIE